MKLECTAKSYCIELSVEDFRQLTTYENLYHGGKDGQGFKGKMLDEILHEMDGVGDCDYNGHYGSCIYFTLEIKHDTAKRHKQIIKAIEARLKEANRPRS